MVLDVREFIPEVLVWSIFDCAGVKFKGLKFKSLYFKFFQRFHVVLIRKFSPRLVFKQALSSRIPIGPFHDSEFPPRVLIGPSDSELSLGVLKVALKTVLSKTILYCIYC